MIDWIKKQLISKLYFQVEECETKCIMTPMEVIELLKESDNPKDYKINHIYMTQSKYESLQEFTGF